MNLLTADIGFSFDIQRPTEAFQWVLETTEASDFGYLAETGNCYPDSVTSRHYV
ncbi:hypothetical protein [Natronorubrum sp. DTA7]|uniref:hypothetical protein n=1 Tax=Natronorubrum sp. DTA7 TaxID=3447016 RepID=UPI003F839691